MPPDAQRSLLECRGLNIRIDSRILVRGLELRVPSRSLLAILGPNGAGKSITLQTFAGLRPAPSEQLSLEGRPLASWPRVELARCLAFLPQSVEDPFPSNVLETVLLGRHPHIPRWQWETAADIDIATRALASVGLRGYEARALATLSGGERRRAALAAVLAQAPRVFLLDEPVNQLDPNHQLETLRLLRAQADAGAAVIVTLHDPNLAARFADHVLLIGKEGGWSWGAVAQALTASSLSALYDTPFAELRDGPRPLYFPA